MKLTYEEQIKRIIRSYNKLPESRVLQYISCRTIDNYYHFFQDCYHLKDWIANDPVIKKNISKQQIDDYINKTKYLKVVGGIANATKHLKLLRKQRAGIDKNIDMNKLKIGKDWGLAVSYGVGKNRKSILADSLAMLAMQEWKVFLLNNGLSSISFERRAKNLF